MTNRTPPFLLPNDARRADLERWRRDGHEAIRLVRRGVEHGWVVTGPPPDRADLEAWRRGWPVHVPGLVPVDAARDVLDESAAMFDRLADGARFLDELATRLDGDEAFEYSGSTVDCLDEREIEKVFACARADGRRIAKDLWAKLSWIADDPNDESLRIRFSFGHERTGDWLEADQRNRAPYADRFAEAVFPERALITEDQDVAALLGALFPNHAVRLTETIVYANAPAGGAVFHHDADPGQRGVLYVQLAGRTAWLALPRDELAALVRTHSHDAYPSAEAATAALVDGPDERLWELLNATPAFSLAAAEQGALHVLEPGHGLFLASHGGDAVTWHAVFALGRRRSLAHSLAVFDDELTAAE